MLHAVEKKKTTYYRRYSGHRDGYEKHVSAEDEITSTVLGPLEFIESDAVFHFWNEVFRLQNCPTTFPAAAPISCEFKLWPKRNGIEPDAHVTFKWADKQRFDILIELKWHAPLSGEDQLQLQWLDYLDEDVRKNSWHVFIAPDISSGIAARDADEVGLWRIGGEDRLVLVSWAQIRDVLSRCEGRNDCLARWAAMASRFLETIGIRRFKGFAEVRHALPAAEVCHRQFFRGLTHGFNGFDRVNSAFSDSELAFQSFFKG